MKRYVLFFMVLYVCFLAGCSHKTAPVAKIEYLHDTIQVYHSDTIRQSDTMFVDRETVIREADSALLAAYGVLGVKLADNERAILVLRKELSEKSKQLSEKTTDTVYQVKEVPVVVKDTEYVEKELNWWQRLKMGLGVIFLLISLAVGIYYGIKIWRNYGLRS